MQRKGIRHDQVNHHHPLADFSYTLFFPVGARNNNIIADSNACVVIYASLTGAEIFEVFAIGSLVPSLLVCLLFAALLPPSLGQLACAERGFLEEQRKAGSGLGGLLPCPQSCTWRWDAEWFRTRHLLSLPPFPSLWNVDGGACFTNGMKLCSCQALYEATHDIN